MKKTITVEVYDKEDYYSSVGEWDEVEEYLEEYGITEQEFEELQERVNMEPNIFSFEEEESVIEEFLKDIEDPNSELLTEIYERLWTIYDIQITEFKVKVLSIK